MIEFLLLVITIQLGFVLSRLPKKNAPSGESLSDRYDRERAKNAALVASQLRDLRLRACSFSLWEPGRIFTEAGSPTADGRGIVIDSDDVWVLIESPAPFGAKGATQRLFRIEDVKSVAEIVG